MILFRKIKYKFSVKNKDTLFDEMSLVENVEKENIEGATGTYFFGINSFIEDLLGFIDGINVSVHPRYLAPSLNTLAITLNLITGLCEIY